MYMMIYLIHKSLRCKNKVLNETRELAAIYFILNKITLDYYIGSASTGRFHSRFVNHLFYMTGSKIVKNAVKKYAVGSKFRGPPSFAFIILLRNYLKKKLQEKIIRN
ncbi:hypothetical protein GCM10010211_65020 [Streptomyces albospinus]|uniref:GIY-YIG domain-containing protein n=1 Tax=Streptomyces albospinus TaxID=285515 RepID=A0ABQ2VL98_9ACTN|nr:hypothetical protein GCM10010211_65020 [Streptomyces albospinus]